MEGGRRWVREGGRRGRKKADNAGKGGEGKKTMLRKLLEQRES